jgi:DnaJ-domain-containing protein 1
MHGFLPIKSTSTMSLTRRLRRIARAQIGDLWSRSTDRDDRPEARADDFDFNAGGTASKDGSTDAPAVPDDVARAYRALEVPVGSDRETVKKGYRRVMKAYHQDRFDEDPERREIAGEVSQRLNAAYETVTTYLDEQDR